MANSGKKRVSALLDSTVKIELSKKTTKTVVLAGIESHDCVLQTAMDSLNSGFQTIILADAVNSRKSCDYEIALKTAEVAGCFLMTVESLLFMLMRDSTHPSFRTVSKIVTSKK